MIGAWRPHNEYLETLEHCIQTLLPQHLSRIEYFNSLISKLQMLNLDNIQPLVIDKYSKQGRPSNQQPELLRALIAMSHLKIHAIKILVRGLHSDPVLATICGFAVSVK